MAVNSVVREQLREKGLALAGAARALRPAALPLVCLAIYAAGAWGLWQHAAGLSGHPSMPQVDGRQCPWLSSADLAAINSGTEMVGRSSLFDRNLCAQVARSYEASPWVERVVAVRRRFPDRVEAELAIRQPFASVHRGGLYLLVDHRGCRLPVAPTARPDVKYPVIEGVTAFPPSAGQLWDDECLNDSLRLAELLDEVLVGRGSPARLTTIEAAKPPRGHDTRPQMVAQLASGTRIDWGSFNESRTCAFPSVSDKRAELERQLKLVPDLSMVGCIKVRYRDGVIVPRPEPLASGAIGMAPSVARDQDVSDGQDNPNPTPQDPNLTPSSAAPGAGLVLSFLAVLTLPAVLAAAAPELPAAIRGYLPLLPLPLLEIEAALAFALLWLPVQQAPSPEEGSPAVTGLVRGLLLAVLLLPFALTARVVAPASSGAVLAGCALVAATGAGSAAAAAAWGARGLALAVVAAVLPGLAGFFGLEAGLPLGWLERLCPFLAAGSALGGGTAWTLGLVPGIGLATASAMLRSKTLRT